MGNCEARDKKQETDRQIRLQEREGARCLWKVRLSRPFEKKKEQSSSLKWDQHSCIDSSSSSFGNQTIRSDQDMAMAIRDFSIRLSQHRQLILQHKCTAQQVPCMVLMHGAVCNACSAECISLAPYSESFVDEEEEQRKALKKKRSTTSSTVKMGKKAMTRTSTMHSSTQPCSLDKNTDTTPAFSLPLSMSSSLIDLLDHRENGQKASLLRYF